MAKNNMKAKRPISTLPNSKTPHEPHKIKTVRHLQFTTREQRKQFLAQTNCNVFQLQPYQVTFDMCSSSLGATSQEQLAGLLAGDEAYAGARNFEDLQQTVSDVFRHDFITPVHNRLGGWKLIAATLVAEARDLDPSCVVVPSNTANLEEVLLTQKKGTVEIRDVSEPHRVFPGNTSIRAAHAVLENENTACIATETFADGMKPLSLENLRTLSSLAKRYNKPLILDASRIVENAWYIQKNEPGYGRYSLTELVQDMVNCCDIVLLDATHDSRCSSGGFLSTNNPVFHEQFMNKVVVYEGLHTYGGMAGRTMEMLARGLGEICDEGGVAWMMHQANQFNEKLLEAGVPLVPGCDGAYLKAKSFLPHLGHAEAKYADFTLSAALYYASGIRAGFTGKVDHANRLLVPVQIPRFGMTSEQLDEVADIIICLHKNRRYVHRGLRLTKSGTWRDQMKFRWEFPDALDWTVKSEIFPYTIHTIEKVGRLDKERREEAIRVAGYNTFLLRSKDVTIDLLTDSGTSAMSTEQWAAYHGALSSASNCESYTRLVDTLRESLGYEFIIPTHQGRAAEQILSEMMIQPGQIVPGNMYFTTTKLHQELAGGVFADVIVEEAHDPESKHPWKGNIDLRKLDALVRQHGAEQIAYVSFEHAVNMAGGQPVSMGNMRTVYDYCSSRGIPVFFDSTRVVENACMIQERDPFYKNVSVRNIVHEIMTYGDGCTISGKKDFLINIGGVLAFRQNSVWAEKAEDLLRVYEGSVKDGGLAAGDLAAMSLGCEEMLDDRYIRSRLKQTQYLGKLLDMAGVPIVQPVGGHAVFLDARRFLPHVPQDEFPAQRLAAEIFVETGVRSMERGTVSKGRNPVTGENLHPTLELVRLTLPRRVYTNDHMKAVADGIVRLYQRRKTIGGLAFVYEPKQLRFFQARFEPIAPEQQQQHNITMTTQNITMTPTSSFELESKSSASSSKSSSGLSH